LEQRGLGTDADTGAEDPLSRDEPLLAALYANSIRGTVAVGPRAGRKVARLGDRINVDTLAVPLGPRCAAVSGFSVHAYVAVAARDRSRLERLIRYAARPPVATERLSLLADGRVAYQLKNPYRDGTTHVVFEPLDFVGKLAALVPPPRFNLVRYHGVLAPAARVRLQIVPEGPAHEGEVSSQPGCATSPLPAGDPAGRIVGAPDHPRSRNYSWAELMRHAGAFVAPFTRGDSRAPRVRRSAHPAAPDCGSGCRAGRAGFRDRSRRRCLRITIGAQPTVRSPEGWVCSPAPFFGIPPRLTLAQARGTG